ncbi:MAG: hypothetical protein ACLBM6_12690 [Cuspidothrix sp.]|jgi:hypothetical protein
MTNSKVRIKDSVYTRIEAESKRLDRTFLETLYFIVDQYFAYLAANVNTPGSVGTAKPSAKMEQPKDDYELDI